MPAGGTPPDPWTVITERGRLPIFQDPELRVSELLLCDADRRQVAPDSPAFAGIIVHPDVAAALWQLLG